MDSEMPQPDPAADTNRVAPIRSDRSLEFEAFWRNLPRKDLVPHRRDIKPARAAALLRDIVMLEARLNDPVSLRIRLVGSAIHERIQRDITGANYLEFREPQYRAATMESARQITGRPCGLWQVMALHYERGFAQNFELTAFPLMGDEEDVPLLLGLMQPVGGLIRALPSGGRPILADTASVFEYLDIGTGKPVP
jgi:hypothetical protein